MRSVGATAVEVDKPGRPGAGGVAAVLPPETLEGWYAVHQVWRVNRAAVRGLSGEARREMESLARHAWGRLASHAEAKVHGSAGVGAPEPDGADGAAEAAAEGATERAGWSAVAELVGSLGDLLVMHFRPTLDAVGEAERVAAASPVFDYLEPVSTFLSVTEAGLYHITAAVAAAREAAGGAAGDAGYQAELAVRSAAERRNPHVARRLYPPLPEGMPYVCFYPMSKRRAEGQNWYALTLAERSRLMQAHGVTGRRYAGRVQQVITGAIGLDAWEWGVTLFAKDPLDIKRLVTDMRFDEVSAQYAEFGSFYVGRLAEGADWIARVLGPRDAAAGI